jgi:Uri superfamily endonuclease
MNTEKELNDWYVYFAIKHLHIDWLKKEKQYSEISSDYIANEEEKTISIELPNNISWVEKQILLLRQEMTCRQIEKQYHINYLKIHRIEKQAKEKIQKWAERKYRELVMQ